MYHGGKEDWWQIQSAHRKSQDFLADCKSIAPQLCNYKETSFKPHHAQGLQQPRSSLLQELHLNL